VGTTSAADVVTAARTIIKFLIVTLLSKRVRRDQSSEGNLRLPIASPGGATIVATSCRRRLDERAGTVGNALQRRQTPFVGGQADDGWSAGVQFRSPL
jgi:hypothetical protein